VVCQTDHLFLFGGAKLISTFTPVKITAMNFKHTNNWWWNNLRQDVVSCPAIGMYEEKI